jgi:hypothetical protein
MNGTTKAKTPQSGSASRKEKAKVQAPHKSFEHPAEVVADPALSKDQKASALESLEQDARQLATASGEGMAGGEGTNLREVLVAKETLELPASDAAFAVVIQTLESKLAMARGTTAHTVIAQAIQSIETARKAIDEMTDVPSTPPGAAKPGSRQELEEELAKEKLDP